MTKYPRFKIRLSWNSKGELDHTLFRLVDKETGRYTDMGVYSNFEGAMARIYTFKLMRKSLV